MWSTLYIKTYRVRLVVGMSVTLCGVCCPLPMQFILRLSFALISHDHFPGLSLFIVHRFFSHSFSPFFNLFQYFSQFFTNFSVFHSFSLFVNVFPLFFSVFPSFQSLLPFFTVLHRFHRFQCFSPLFTVFPSFSQFFTVIQSFFSQSFSQFFTVIQRFFTAFHSFSQFFSVHRFSPFFNYVIMELLEKLLFAHVERVSVSRMRDF